MNKENRFVPLPKKFVKLYHSQQEDTNTSKTGTAASDLADIFTSTHELCEEYKTLFTELVKTGLDGFAVDDMDIKKYEQLKQNLLGRKEVFMAWKEMCNMVIDNDKTYYEYSKGQDAMNNKGELPEGIGERFLTPREIAKNNLKEIDAIIKAIEEALRLPQASETKVSSEIEDVLK